jgi:hypothetical protein
MIAAYLMDRNLGMAATVAPYMPTEAQVAANHWLLDRTRKNRNEIYLT